MAGPPGAAVSEPPGSSTQRGSRANCRANATTRTGCDSPTSRAESDGRKELTEKRRPRDTHPGKRGVMQGDLVGRVISRTGAVIRPRSTAFGCPAAPLLLVQEIHPDQAKNCIENKRSEKRSNNNTDQFSHLFALIFIRLSRNRGPYL